MRFAKVFFFSLLGFSFLFSVGTTGKIAGTITDAKTKEKLIGVNVVIEGTTLGAASNIDGYFYIINVPPGTYRLKASYLGYAPAIVQDIRVSIDQTTPVDITLEETAISTQEVVIVANRPVVQRDVASSRASLQAREIENLPVSQVSTIIGLQAGVEGLSVRGGGSDQTAFVLNGLTLRNDRDNTPYTGVSMLAIQELQIQTGGFSAEYGNIRSGVVNAVTKDGSIDRYTFAFSSRYSPPAQKYFGMLPNDPNSYWIKPFVDDAVAWTGTKNGAWDDYTQRQYREFKGWNEISRQLLADQDPNNDLSPEAAQRLFLWQHRKNFVITRPDYTLDGAIGGPVPGGDMLGNLRFFLSSRFISTQYAIPLSRDASTDYSHDLKLTSDIAPGMKLMGEYLTGRNDAVDANQTGVYGSFGSAASLGSSMNRVSYIDTRLFATDYWAPNSVDRNMQGLKFTHLLSQESFYEVTLQRFASYYSTNPGRLRDTSRVNKFGNNYFVDEAPFGWFPDPGNYSATGIDGLRMAIGMSNARDSSSLVTYTGKADFVTQLDRYNQLKAGFEYTYIDNDVNYGSIDVVLPTGRSLSRWHTFPKRIELYVKDKLEFEGMVADIGIRYSSSQAGGEWYQYDPFTRSFSGTKSLGIDTLVAKAPTATVTAWSPRIGIAFPITENSKLFFNYGHFRQMPNPEALFLVRRETTSKSILRIANPNLPFPKTVAYELGYEQSLLDEYLLRISGYYKDVSDQSRLVTYIGYNNTPNYSVYTNNSYEDIRGFELTLTKNRGEWVQGFFNYTYMVSTSGAFGRPTYYQNPVDQRNDEAVNIQQFKPLPQPYARANIDIFTPRDFGPEVGGIVPFADWRINLLGSWSSGFYITYVGGGSFPGVSNNLQWKDQFGLDLRFSKAFRLGRFDLQFYIDVNNLLNLRQLTTYGFVDGSDYDSYMKSLHLSQDMNQYGYGNIEGSDRPGDYRKMGVEYQPMLRVDDITKLPSDVTNPSKVRPFYYVADAKTYYRYDAGNATWLPVEPSKLNQVLDDKAYIDMPNQEWFNFLNPRQIFYGLKVSFDLN